MRINLILSVLGFGLLLSACSPNNPVEAIIPPVEVVTVETKRPKPIVPSVERLDLREVEWIVITEENKDLLLQGDLALFALTANGYENLSLNMADISALIQQQQKIIAIYQSSYD